MNIYKIKQHISGDPDKIITLLDLAGFSYIKHDHRKGHIRCGRGVSHNPTAVLVDVNTLSATIFSKGIYGDIITILQYNLGYGFYNTLKFIVSTLKIDDCEYSHVELPFGGYYKKLCYDGRVGDIEIEPYDESILKEFWPIPSSRFVRDGISYDTQIKYGIGYDRLTDRISVPWHYTDGSLAGVMGRRNDSCDEVLKWMPIYPFPKSYCLFGFVENYAQILQNKRIILTESEKGVMQLDSMNIYYGLATGGSNITDNQVDYIKALRPVQIIIAYDEGMEINHIQHQAQKLKGNSIFTNTKIGYIHDKFNTVLKKGSKLSPTDVGYELFKKLMEESVIWI